jgi:hypothetical protein
MPVIFILFAIACQDHVLTPDVIPMSIVPETIRASTDLLNGFSVQNMVRRGTNFDLSSGSTTHRRSPSVAHNAIDNEYLAVWFDARNPGENDVFGQRVSTTGALLGGNIPIIGIADAQIDPIVAHNGTNNEYLVAWRTQQQGAFNALQGRRLSKAGALLGPDFFILNSGGEGSVVHNPTANEYLLTGRGQGVHGRRVGPGGSLLGPEITIAVGGAEAPNGQVAYNGNANEYLATWRDQVAANLKARRIASDGSLVGNTIVVSPNFPSSFDPTASVAFDPDRNRYLIVFALLSSNEIRGQFVAGSGQLDGVNFPIVQGLRTRPIPYVAYSASAQAFVVVWNEAGDIQGRLLSAEGALVGSPLMISAGTASGGPRSAYNSRTGEVLVVWSDTRNLSRGSGEEDIYAQRIAIVSCVLCVLVPTTFTRSAGKVSRETREFAADPSASYVLVIHDDGQPNTAAQVTLNGVTIVNEKALRQPGINELRISVTLEMLNHLSVTALGSAGAYVTLSIRRT